MPVPVLTVEQVRAWEEASWRSGISSEKIIRNAGTRIGNRLMELTQPGSRILILAGRGNNGADAREAVRALSSRDVQFLEVRNAQACLGSFRDALSRKPHWIVDGLFGIGLNRELDSSWVSFIRALNQSGIPVVSIDVPSGLDGDSGMPRPLSVKARRTLTLGSLKHGLLKPQAAEWVGIIELIHDIGLGPLAVDDASLITYLDDEYKSMVPVREAVSHKGTFGHLGIVAGSLGTHGAAVLAARGALRSRPGLVSVITSPEVYLPVASQLSCPMVHPWSEDRENFGRFDCLLIGPGLASASGLEWPKRRLSELWGTFGRSMVVDASALDWVQVGEVCSDAPRVLTPHPGEAGRMLGVNASTVQADRPWALKELSRRYGGCWVVLKGARTLIGNSHRQIVVNLSGNPGLAQGGSGDLLAGYVAGLLAQSNWASDPLRALAYAVWMHGRAADALELKQMAWTTDDLERQLADYP